MPGNPSPFTAQFAVAATNNLDPTLPPVGDANKDQAVSQPVQYNTPPQIWPPPVNVQLFVTGKGEVADIEPSDINQGELGDCWMLTALSLLANYGTIGANNQNPIKSAFVGLDPNVPAPQTVTVTIYQPPNPSAGQFQSANPIQQTVGWSIPTLVPAPNSQNPPSIAFVQSDTAGEYWPCMMEKAAAACVTNTINGVAYTGYAAIIGGFSAVGMSLFTAGLPVSYDISAGKPAPDDLYNAWYTCMQNGISIGLAWNNANNGLVSGHAYGVFGLVQAGGFKLAKIRNPWGGSATAVSCSINGGAIKGKWTGDWSDCSGLWASNPAVATACKFAGPTSDGFFWMAFTDIVANMDSYEIFIPSSPDFKVDLTTFKFNNAVCTDTIPNWQDTNGNTCANFTGSACQGGVALVNLSNYTDANGLNPTQVCCACGGGNYGPLLGQ